MVKYPSKREETDLSTSHSLCSESEVPLTETLLTIIEQMPKLTSLERRQGMRSSQCVRSNSRKWSQNETKQFYQLLCHFGLDFTLISYHPTFHNKRSQKELSNKYKKELKNNPANINTVLNRID
jgi:hypothetical protein